MDGTFLWALLMGRKIRLWPDRRGCSFSVSHYQGTGIVELPSIRRRIHPAMGRRSLLLLTGRLPGEIIGSVTLDCCITLSYKSRIVSHPSAPGHGCSTSSDTRLTKSGVVDAAGGTAQHTSCSSALPETEPTIVVVSLRRRAQASESGSLRRRPPDLAAGPCSSASFAYQLPSPLLRPDTPGRKGKSATSEHSCSSRSVRVA